MENSTSSATDVASEIEPPRRIRKNTILYMSTFPPRECGIATFTSDIITSIDKQLSSVIMSKVIALNDDEINIYNYPKKVVSSIWDKDISGYIEMAHKINRMPHVRLVNIQHEFGIFGGEYGDDLLTFLEMVEKPVIITFHSVLPDPSEKLKKVVRDIGKRVESIIVMTKTGVEILRNDYGLENTIHVIPHGIPEVQFESQAKEKKALGLKDKFIISSFGLLSEGKGYEYVIEALPDLVKKYPNLLYVIVGQTHPVVRRNEGENYRNYLKSLVKKHNLQKHVKFYNKYVELEEIIKYLKATDIYISSSQNPDQVTSGTLSYALGVGRAVISTPFIHAKDLVTPDIGILAEFEDSMSFKNAIDKLAGDKSMLKEMEQNAYLATRHMTWPNVALSYGKAFNNYLDLSDIYFKKIPKVNLNHVKALTDDFGMIQFTNFTKPDIESGYTLDDNARALTAVAKLYRTSKKNSYLKLIKTYFDLIKHCQDSDGKFYNYINKNKELDKGKWIEDAHGRGLAALGHLSSMKEIPNELIRESKRLFEESLPVIENTAYPRAAASTLIGLYDYNKANPSQKNIEIIKKLAELLVSYYEENNSEDWNWFEPKMTYSNAVLPEALFTAYEVTNNEKYLDVATKTIDFLLSKTFENEIFIPIGQEGWYEKDSERAYFDQQPVEVDTTISALIKAHKILKNPRYKRCAINTFNWFFGKNTLEQFMYNENTGGCYDGLGKLAVNVNQGAESTLAYLNARLALPNL